MPNLYWHTREITGPERSNGLKCQTGMRRDQHTVREVHLKKMVTDTLKIAAFVGEISKRQVI